MAKRWFSSGNRFVRNAIREDLLYFALPALIVFTTGLGVSARDGLIENILNLIRQAGNLNSISIQNIFGLVLYFSGLTIAIVAQITLWRFYSSTLVIREDHQLITHGPYRFVRHPIYLGVIIAILGLPIFASSLGGLLTMSILILIFLIRIRIEERMLTDEFGDAYRTYKKSTRKLIPFIY